MKRRLPISDERASLGRARVTSWLVCIASLLPGACSTAAVKDRWKDFTEIVDVVGSVSQGVQLQAHATQVIQAGAGSTIGWKAGLKNGHLDCWMEERNEFGLSLIYDHELYRSKGSSLIDVRYPLFGDPGYNWRFPEWRLLTDRDLLDVGAAINIVYLGLDLNIRTYQIADFFTGILGYDLLRDDCYTPDLTELVGRLRSDSARTRANAADALRRRTGEDMGYVQWTVRGETIPEQRDAARRFSQWLKEHEPAPTN